MSDQLSIMDKKRKVPETSTETSTVKVRLVNGSIYTMSGERFQEDWVHGIPEERKNECGPRISVTARFMGSKQPVTGDKVDLRTVFDSDDSKLQVGKLPIDVTYTSLLTTIGQYLSPDITKMFGRTYTNNGRQVCTFSALEGLNGYKYSGKTVKTHPMPPMVKEIMGSMMVTTKTVYN